MPYLVSRVDVESSSGLALPRSEPHHVTVCFELLGEAVWEIVSSVYHQSTVGWWEEHSCSDHGWGQCFEQGGGLTKDSTASDLASARSTWALTAFSSRTALDTWNWSMMNMPRLATLPWLERKAGVGGVNMM